MFVMGRVRSVSYSAPRRERPGDVSQSEVVSRGARRFVGASVLFLIAAQGAALAGAGRRTVVSLTLLGFVFHMLFGKAYSLVPSYFVRELAFPRAPALQLPFSLVGAVGVGLAPLPGVPAVVGAVGGVAWVVGVAVFLATVLWTLRGNLLGGETGTSEANVHRGRVDRVANAAVPVALSYFAVGSYEVAALETGLPRLLGGSLAADTHLLAAGTAALMVLAVGLRLLPRFLVATPPWPLVVVVLPAGAVGPALLAGAFLGGPLFLAGAVLEAVAVLGFAATYGVLYWRTDRDRVGFTGVLAGAVCGVLGIGLGLQFAVAGLDPALAVAHFRLNLVGFLGLTIVGVAYQFYPPAVGTFPGAGDRAALASIWLVFGGLLVEVAGIAGGRPTVASLGQAVGLAGAILYAYIVLGLFRQRYGWLAR